VKNRMVHVTVCSTIAPAFLLSAAWAAPKAGKDAKPGKPDADQALQEITLTGTIEQIEMTRKNKKTGEEKTIQRLVLTTADGSKVSLPATRKGAGADSAPDATAFVGKTVKIVGMGKEVTRRRGQETKTMTLLRQITSIEETVVEGDAAAGDEDE